MVILFVYWAVLGILFEIIGGIFLVKSEKLKKLEQQEKSSKEREKGLTFVLGGVVLVIIGIISLFQN